MDLAGIAPDRLADLALRPRDLAGQRGLKLDLAVRHRNDHVWQIVSVPPFALAGLDHEVPHAHALVLEHHIVADRAKLELADVLSGHEFLLFRPFCTRAFKTE